LLAKYPHHLLDLCDPSDSYSAAQFRTDALKAIDGILHRGRLPLLVGGTGMYFRVLEDGIAELPHRDPDTHRRLEDELAKTSLASMHARLAAVDPDSGQRIHPHDSQRILRALGVYELSGRPMTELLRRTKLPPPSFSIMKLVLAPHDRAWLHDRITRRFRAMLAAGFINEVGALRDHGGLSLDLPALRAVGYRAIWRYLEGEYSFEEMVEQGIIATRQLAKRQLTWFRGISDAKWLDSSAADIENQLAVALKRHIKVK
ncbi:MAG: tRNA (adenosine(37)-N6)-dimethylallyltransferase MiaA, partial [Gammaproteobacteria bacterium]